MTGLGPGKPLALLAYLSVRREARRDELVDLLWGEVSEANARNAFRQALHRLRTALGEDIIPMDRDRVELAESAGIENDRDLFLNALERGDVAAAIDAYRGDFLEGFDLGEPVFDSWVDAERTRLKNRFQLALQAGAESALAAGRWLEALQYVQRLTAVAPYDESAALLEANVLVAAGRGSEAAMALRRFSETLRVQLDLPPSAKVREMLTRIERADQARESTPASPRAKEIPFFGRELEIARMMSLARGMAAEEGATLFVEGPAGIGKSRLVAEFLTRAKSLGPLLVLRGRERPTNAALPYASVAEALRSALRAPGVAGTGRHLLSEAARILPELRDSFDLPEPLPIDADGGRLRFFEGIAALLDAAAYEQPVCLVLDDVHHASASTVDLVGYLGARLQTSPVLLILIHRELDESSPLGRIRDGAGNAPQGEAAAEVLRIGPLEQESLRRLVGHIVATAANAGPLDLDRVAAAAAGNPLRAIDLARRALNGELPSAAVVPLRDILWSRLQKASPSQRRVFFAAALLQRRCPLRLLASAAHLPELATFDAAQELERLGLLAQEAVSYVIAHDFTAAFVADASGMAGRALLAGWAADALAQERFASSDELANLYAIAGRQDAAFAHARRAVYVAAALGSAPEVNRLLGLALALAPDQGTRAEIEEMVVAFGSGVRLLESPGARDRHVAAPAGTATEVDQALPADTGHAPSRPRTSRLRRPLLNGRLAALMVAGVVVISLALGWRLSRPAAGVVTTLRDSLLVAERGSDRGSDLFVITGPIGDVAQNRMGLLGGSKEPEWVDSLSLPWIRPIVSPSGLVAAERMGIAGTDVFLVTEPGGTAIPVATGGGIDAILGWSPDGASLLVRRSKVLPDGAFDADLWSFRIEDLRVVASTAVDTSSLRSVEEASWSPDGSRIAWVAQSGPAHQRDVFASRPDGSDVVNLTESPGEDYHVAWASDGNLLAFTSDRDGNPDLFAVEFLPGGRRLWRLTRTPAEEDFASFSPDHRFVAFQSTAGGDAAVYVMAALGGVPTRVTPAGGQFSIVGWRGSPPATYVDRFRIIGPTTVSMRDSVVLSLFGADRSGNTRLPDGVTIGVVEPGAARLERSGVGSRHGYVLRPLREGPVTVVASIPGWRHDTLTIQVGESPLTAIADDFSSGIAPERWISLGSPRPLTRTDASGTAMYPNGDVEWPSGVLSRVSLSLRDSVDVSATFRAPFSGRPVAAAQLKLALVASGGETLDSVAPQPQEYVSVAWDGEASRFTYSVGPESKSDPVSVIGAGSARDVRIVVGADGGVSFFVSSRLRWRSSLRFIGGPGDREARLWLGGRATGTAASISNVRAAAK
ncbi:MAG TPA: AAA family ATPase [Gemmatimonadaceae bacterium]|nr:AAA family ATPase [Gemmatimonadaceae bacterium]